MEAALYDAHCHLGFCPDPVALARELAARGVGGLCCTVTPAEFARVCRLDGGVPGWRLGAGAHPWWAQEVRPAEAATAAARSPLVGEVGLDFGPRHASTRARQVEILAAILDAVRPGAVLSIHAVRSAATVLDLLEARGLTDRCTCIFHWYSDSNEALTRALRAGCYFSVGTPMMRTRRGRAYACQLPADRLLLETDLPAHDGAADPVRTADLMAADLRAALGQLAALRGVEKEALSAGLARTSRAVLGL